jgi:hypothetical protein
MNTKNINKPVFIPTFRQSIENPSAQPHSKFSKWGVGILRGLRSLGILGRKTGMENTPAQRHSKSPNPLKIRLLNGTLNSPSAWLSNLHYRRNYEFY